MPRVEANGLEFEYETFGAADAPPLLLIMGLGAQMISWDEEFCELLADRGFHVVRFDNRDVGLSTKLDHLGTPELQAVASGAEAPPYHLEDLADDAAGILAELGIDAAHVVGASMGGFIAQLVAIRHPERVLSLTSIMSAPGGMRDNAPATPEAMEALLKPPPADREGMIEHGVWISSRICGPAHFDPEDARRKRIRAIDRSVSVAGTARQIAAIAAAPSRVERLRELDVPALIVHGDHDAFAPLAACGRRSAELMPRSRLQVYAGAAHMPHLSHRERLNADLLAFAGARDA
ncbi:MAG TPA: alpha/beta hydrolase [Streptosporangiaceae bacterium]|nr:alpha/beta hydrolase [Streptosporangiaceae bacterium]